MTSERNGAAHSPDGPTDITRGDTPMSATTVAFVAPTPDKPLNGAPNSILGQHNPRSFVSPAGVVYELVHVTPTIAEQWLVRNTNNRALRLDAVDKLGRDMAARRFLENGDAVRFSTSGTLLDGQHRLEGLVSSGMSVWMLVVSNLPDQARDTVDDGTKRTMADRFAFHGEADPKTLAAVVRRALLWDRGQKNPTAKFQPSALESFEFLAEHPELREAASAAAHYRRTRLLSASTIGLCWWLFSRIDADQSEEFFDRLSDGAMLPGGHPVLTLRNRLNALNKQQGRVPSSHTTALTIKAWNYYREGQTLRTIRHADHEKYPTPK